MTAFCSFYKSTLGKKVVVAVTGAVLFGFVFAHMLGNLKAFMGTDAISGLPKLDIYAKSLREIAEHFVGHGTVLWLARGVLLGSVLLHIATVVQLRALSRSSRPQPYHGQKYSAATLPARMMWWGGVILAAFIVFHILHFTTGQAHFHGFVEGRVYSNVYRAFEHWQLVLLYGVAMAALSMHLYHGGWSLFQTLGIDNPDRNSSLRTLAKVASLVICLGFFLVPLAVITGVLPPPSKVQSPSEEY